MICIVLTSFVVRLQLRQFGIATVYHSLVSSGKIDLNGHQFLVALAENAQSTGFDAEHVNGKIVGLFWLGAPMLLHGLRHGAHRRILVRARLFDLGDTGQADSVALVGASDALGGLIVDAFDDLGPTDLHHVFVVAEVSADDAELGVNLFVGNRDRSRLTYLATWSGDDRIALCIGGGDMARQSRADQRQGEVHFLLDHFEVIRDCVSRYSM